MGHPLRHALVGALAVVLLAACTSGPPAGPATPGDPAGTGAATPATTPAAPATVRVEAGDDVQAAVDAAPAGTTFVLGAGVHRAQQVRPRTGDVFVGEDGAAVMRGAEVIEGFAPDDGRWVADADGAPGFAHGEVLEGREAVRHPEQVFLDDERLVAVDDVGDVVAGTWHLDRDAGRLHLGEDPAGRVVELSRTPHAFVGGDADDVVLRDLVVERYANRAQIGAIHPDGSDGWRIADSTVRDNHGAGITVSPGMVATGLDVHGNGQIGMAGDCGGEGRPIRIEGNRVHGNGGTGFDWRWEAGGIKLKDCRVGTEVVGNHVHDNVGPGIWVDIDSAAVTIADNVVTGNSGAGIFYEISFGPSAIERNLVDGNGADDFGIAVRLSSCTDVVVRDNDVRALDVGFAIQDHETGEGPHGVRELTGVALVGNAVRAPRPLVIDRVGLEGIPADLRLEGNAYALDDDDGDGHVADVDGERFDEATWRDVAGEGPPADAAGSGAPSAAPDPDGYGAPGAGGG